MRRLGSASIALAGLLVFGPAPSTPAEPDAGPPSTPVAAPVSQVAAQAGKARPLRRKRGYW